MNHPTPMKHHILLERLHTIEKELKILEAAIALLRWDEDTIMPSAAAAQRAEQLAYLSKIHHEKKISAEVQDIVRALLSEEHFRTLTQLDQDKAKRWEHKLRKLTRVPSTHVEELARARSAAFEAWQKARERKDYGIFAPHLRRVIELKKKEAALIDSTIPAYDVLIDDYEEGMAMHDIDALFTELKQGLRQLTHDIMSSPVRSAQKDTISSLPFPAQEQRAICRELMRMILADEKRTVIAESIHPFMTTISADDIRLTTAVREAEPLFSFGSTAHECGHALYELNFGAELRDSILFDAPSMGMHESQSRLWENHICLGKPFWNFFYPHYQSAFPALKNISLEQFYMYANTVTPSLIRIESDEVTYGLHIIIRYEIEKGIFDGTISTENIPQEWNKRYKEYLGVDVSDDKVGVLQDVHWSHGDFGYFPTYALGTIYAAMIYAALCYAHPSTEEEIMRGDFNNVRAWLCEHIHKHGARKSTKELIYNACGTELSCSDYLRYLREKYTALYQLKA